MGSGNGEFKCKGLLRRPVEEAYWRVQMGSSKEKLQWKAPMRNSNRKLQEFKRRSALEAPNGAPESSNGKLQRRVQMQRPIEEAHWRVQMEKLLVKGHCMEFKWRNPMEKFIAVSSNAKAHCRGPIQRSIGEYQSRQVGRERCVHTVQRLHRNF